MLHVQLISMELPSAECVYAGHWMHVDSSILPVSVEYLPCEHREQGAEPFTSLYVPAMHAVHFMPSGPVYPRLQVQFDLTTLPLPENEADGQFQQKELPVSFANLPASQAEHAPLSHCASIE